MQPYRELGNELDKNYDDIVDLNGKQWFKWHHNRKFFGYPLFCCGVWEGLSSCGLAREGWKEDWLEWVEKHFFLSSGGGVFLFFGVGFFFFCLDVVLSEATKEGKKKNVKKKKKKNFLIVFQHP